MRIIHTADLHLGRSLHERDLLADQEAMLDSLLSYISSREVDLLLIAGDIYDRAIPQPGAIALFDSFLSRALAARPGLSIVAIPGNHDSASRLSFGAELLSRAGLHLRVRPADCVEPILVGRGEDSLAVWALPFLNPGAFPPSGPAPDEALPPSAQGELFSPEPDSAGGVLRSQAELFAEALGRIRPRLKSGSPNVLLAHCFAAGSASSESERSFVGAAEEVPPSLFEGFDYVALGHLHRHQPAGRLARYPGSPLAYSFSEVDAQAEKGFLLIEFGPQGLSETFLPHTPLHPVRRLSGSFAELTAPGAGVGLAEAYVEIRLTDPLPILDPLDALKVNFPNLLSLRQAAFEIEAVVARGGTPAEGEAPGGTRPSILEDFLVFYEEMHKEAPDAASLALFQDLLEEASHAPA